VPPAYRRVVPPPPAAFLAAEDLPRNKMLKPHNWH
jgi:hypothetical protein